MQRLLAFDKRLLDNLFVIFIFALALLPRLGEGVSRPNVWYERSYVFSLAVLEGDWAETFQRYHPGVTFMWLASLGIQPYLQRNGFLTEAQVLVHEPVTEEALSGLIAAALLPTTMVIAGGIALAFVWLRPLIGHKMALAATLFIAFDPLHLTNSKVAHLDGLLAILMLLAAVAMLRYVKGHGYIYLLMSGMLAGFSLLTKTSSIFLIPYVALLLGWQLVWSWWVNGRMAWNRKVLIILADLVFWLAIMAATIYVFFPALWVEPGHVLAEMWGNLTRHATNVHKNPVFFGGRVWLDDDPGFPFYAVIIAFKMTAITLVFIVVGLLFVGKRPLQPASHVLGAMAAFAFFFYCQMSIGDFKQMSYILPALPAINVVAGVGLVWGVEWLVAQLKWPETAVIGGVAGFLLLHILLVLPAYPLFGTYHNWLLGGTRTAVQLIPIQEQAEGVDAALNYINDLPYSDKATIAISARLTSFAQRWHNACYRTETPINAAFRIYDVNSLKRNNLNEAWWQQWQEDRQNAPLYQAAYDGVTYAWVYGEMLETYAADEPLPSLFQFGDAIRLITANLNQDTLRPGDNLEISLAWAADDWICDSYKVFVHVYDADDFIVAQQDVLPLNGAQPTWIWQPGNLLDDVVTVSLPPDLAEGAYTVAVGMYDEATLARLPLEYTREGTSEIDTAVLSTITIIR